jgi:phage terminase small subunit
MEKTLTPKQDMFVREYLVDLNGTQAAIRAGYSKKTADRIAEQNLRKLGIQAAIQEAKLKREQKTEISAEYVITTIRNTIERCSQAVPVLDKEGNPTGQYRFDAQAVLKGTELLGKHLSIFTERKQLDLTSSDGSMSPVDPTPAIKSLIDAVTQIGGVK